MAAILALNNKKSLFASLGDSLRICFLLVATTNTIADQNDRTS
jgi:hypothetical protein